MLESNRIMHNRRYLRDAMEAPESRGISWAASFDAVQWVGLEAGQ